MRPPWKAPPEKRAIFPDRELLRTGKLSRGGDVTNDTFYSQFGLPIGLSLLDGGESDEKTFLSLPEETQQELLKQKFGSQKELHDRLEELKLKE